MRSASARMNLETLDLPNAIAAGTQQIPGQEHDQVSGASHGMTPTPDVLPPLPKAGVPLALPIGLWVIGLALLIGFGAQHLIPAVEQRLQAAVAADLAAYDEPQIAVSVAGYSVVLDGRVGSQAQRMLLIEAAYRHPGVKEGVDNIVATTLDSKTESAPETIAALPVEARTAETPQTVAQPSRTPPALPFAELLATTQPRSGPATPRRRAEGMPRTTVFGAILPPWRAPPVYKPTAEITTAELIPDTIPTPAPDPASNHEPVGAADDRMEQTEVPKEVPKEVPEEVPQNEALQARFDALPQTSIAFATDSNRLTASSRTTLDTLAALLAEFPQVMLDIGGHTDSAGGELDNLYLSQERSNQVRDYLVRRGVSPYRLLARGFGENLPIADNRTARGRAANRRIQFLFREEVP